MRRAKTAGKNGNGKSAKRARPANDDFGDRFQKLVAEGVTVAIPPQPDPKTPQELAGQVLALKEVEAVPFLRFDFGPREGDGDRVDYWIQRAFDFSVIDADEDGKYIRVLITPNAPREFIKQVLQKLTQLVDDDEAWPAIQRKPELVAAALAAGRDDAAKADRRARKAWEKKLAKKTPQQIDADPNLWPVERIDPALKNLKRAGGLLFLKSPEDVQRRFAEATCSGGGG